ncbi:MAG: hypothetical protein AB7S75_14585 [Desulfococcaceae bacterium]
MTHHHDHNHGHLHHDHDHDHEHYDHNHEHYDHNHEHHEHDHGHHEHSSSPAAEMSFGEKMTTLLEHWLNHNADHAENYRQWAQKASENHMEDVGKVLEEIAVMTIEMNRKLESAAVLAKKSCK